ncbi:hypothetical protein IVB33_39345 [Bradyrhizobium sp. 24]|uniref:hypothetical protein n=1 Tax=Bradyrhizobium sp. 40 TaxID=2782674 RepID=UPI001FFE363D|nr:hypothetical protein [Bradyrhizobium sp. 40]MCK1303459.1 hypothetical protein [Bradyrhizobium sp. 37]MCK1382414.1 hypothetical protein [Bradyrhizobium sp. 24]MCK1770534.1 hypothetical protein [Bradyrhizobium sp. 134]UPJ44571.1 hypothetical protein IVB40_11370 [Bradyrhizobium sp. 40]
MRGNDRGVALLILCHLVLGSISLICVARIYPVYSIIFDNERLPTAIATVAAFAVLTILFVRARFSFGYFAGYYLFVMIAGYLWLNNFTEFDYNHRLSGLSAAASAVAFLLPALHQPTLPRLLELSPQALERLLGWIVLIGAAVAAIGAYYNFRLVSLGDIYTYREALTAPALVNYLVGITMTALLPFAFACYAVHGKLWRAGAVVILLLLFYPVTLSKQAFFAPAWLVLMFVVTRFIGLRLTVILSLLLPTATGLVLFSLYQSGLLPERSAMPVFQLVNLRMVAIPSLAMDYYNAFFFNHEQTHFCQISYLKPIMPCHYREPLAVVIYNWFGIGGYMNASLFATEGVASVGPLLAPISALVCGIVVAIANGMSAGASQRIVLVSSALLPQTLLNVPFTTVMLTHGAVVLFLLWYVMPRDTTERAD